MYFFTRVHTEEEGRGVQNGQVAELLVSSYVVAEYLRIDAVGRNVIIADWNFLVIHFLNDLVEIHISRLAFQMRFSAAENNLLQIFRESAIWNTELAVKEVNYRKREVDGIAMIINIFF